MAKLETFVADFTGALDTTTVWTLTGSASASGGVCHLPLTTGYANTLETRTHYDLTDSSIIWQMFPPATMGSTNRPDFYLHLNRQDGYGSIDIELFHNGTNLTLVPGGIYANATGGGFTNVFGTTTTTYNAVSHAWFRLDLTSTTLTLAASPDAVTWSTIESQTVDPTRFTDLTVKLEAGWYTSPANPTQDATYDNINNPPPPSGIVFSSGGEMAVDTPRRIFFSSGGNAVVDTPRRIFFSSGGDARVNQAFQVKLSSGGGLDGAVPERGPGRQFLFGMSVRGVPDGSVNAYLPDAIAIAGTWTDVSVAAQLNIYNLAPGGEYEHWTGALDWAFGGIFPSGGDSWAAAGGGAYLTRWRASLSKIREYWVGAGRDPSLLRLRFAHEANGSFSGWAVSNSDAPHFRDAYKLWADLVAEILPGAWRMQSFNYGTSSLTDVHDMLVTGRWADALSVDYYNAWPHATTSGQVSTHMNATSGANPVGVEKWRQLAESLGLPLAVSEWGNPAVDTGGGAGGGDAPLFMSAMLDFFHTNAGNGPGQVAHAVYFNAGTTEGYPAEYLVLPPGSSLQPSSTAVLTGATNLSVIVGGAVNNVPGGTSTSTGAVGTTVSVGQVGTGTGDFADTVAPPAPAIPGTYAVPSDFVPLKRISDIYPDPTFVDGKVVGQWTPSSTVVEDWGSFRIIADGIDISFFRGGMVIPDSFDEAEPFGEQTAAFSVSAAVPTDVPGSGDLSWLRDGASIDIVHLSADGSTASIRWAGEIIDFSPTKGDSDWTWQVQCIGALMTASLSVQKPPTFRDPTDIARVIATTLDNVVSRSYGVNAEADTGILTTKRGSADQTVIDFVQDLLSTATTADGTNQYTVQPMTVARTYHVALKNRTGETWTINANQPGVDVNLSWDASTCPNVIYGRGIRADGYAWANWQYPGQGDIAPAYPFASAGTVMTVGTTDASTVGGNGVSTWQQQLNGLGIPGASVTVDGVYSAADAAAAKVVQRSYGILVDGVVGPQTWAAAFDVGANGANLDSAFRLPLYWDPLVEPYYYTASGAITRPSPGYNANVQRRETDINFGSNVTKTEGYAAARAYYQIHGKPGWAGTVTLRADPNQGSMFEIRAGHNIRLRGWGSPAGPLLHISGLSVNPVDQSVTLTVDEKARDLQTLVEIMNRNRDAATNPARLPEPKQRRSRIQSDAVVEFDGESVGGKIGQPRPIALYGGLWSVIRVPVSQVGTVAKIELTTTSPASEFTVAFFGAPVTAAQLITHVGSSPLTARSDHFGPYDWDYDALIALGFQEAIGGPNQAAGYDPGYQTSPIDGGKTPLTGRLISTGSWTFQSVKPPWLWIALWAKSSCFISGRLFPQPIDL